MIGHTEALFYKETIMLRSTNQEGQRYLAFTKAIVMNLIIISSSSID